MLKPVALFPDITRKNAFLVMTEVMLLTVILTHQMLVPFLTTKVSGSVLNKNTFLHKMTAP